MKFNPLVSVIVPVYNCEDYLRNCIDSILTQTYINLQIIAIDDGSTDKSGEILDEYAVNDSRFEVHHCQNVGASAARNMGLKFAVGECITFVDSDDALEPDMYKIMIEKFLVTDIDIVHCGYRKIMLDGTSKSILGTNSEYCFNQNEGMSHFIKGDLFTGALWNKVYKHTVIKNLCFDEKIKINEDVLFNYFAFKRARKTIFIDKPLYHYYERKNASTKRTKSQKIIHDCVWVAKNIYDASIGEQYEALARSKYIKQLMNLYRGLIFESVNRTSEERKKIKRLLSTLLLQKNEVNERFIINYRMMLMCPHIYIILYSIYNKIRKPNWDIGS